MRIYGLSAQEKLLRLIPVRSTTPPNNVAEMAAVLAQFGKDTGADVSMPEVEPDKPNCLLTYSFGEGPVLAMNTHMDVNNPAGQHWGFDPFAPFVRGDRLYGLGACDAKGSLCAMLSAIERLVRNPQGLQGRLVLTAVMGEEAGGLGSAHLMCGGFQADAAIVGEPTALQVCTVHKGTYMRRVSFQGRAVHSARSYEGINAIEHAAAFIVRYAALGRRLAQEGHPILGPANASTTVVEGGTRQNTIPERCGVIIDRRLIPGETAVKADAELDALLAALREEVPQLSVTVETIVSTVPSETPVEAAVVGAMCAAVAAATGEPRVPTGFNGGCDMSKLVGIGHIPTVIFGPGSMEQAHAPDEFVEIGQLGMAQAAYEAAARMLLRRA